MDIVFYISIIVCVVTTFFAILSYFFFNIKDSFIKLKRLKSIHFEQSKVSSSLMEEDTGSFGQTLLLSGTELLTDQETEQDQVSAHRYTEKNANRPQTDDFKHVDHIFHTDNPNTEVISTAALDAYLNQMEDKTNESQHIDGQTEIMLDPDTIKPDTHNSDQTEIMFEEDTPSDVSAEEQSNMSADQSIDGQTEIMLDPGTIEPDTHNDDQTEIMFEEDSPSDVSVKEQPNTSADQSIDGQTEIMLDPDTIEPDTHNNDQTEIMFEEDTPSDVSAEEEQPSTQLYTIDDDHTAIMSDVREDYGDEDVTSIFDDLNDNQETADAVPHDHQQVEAYKYTANDHTAIMSDIVEDSDDPDITGIFDDFDDRVFKSQADHAEDDVTNDQPAYPDMPIEEQNILDDRTAIMTDIAADHDDPDATGIFDDPSTTTTSIEKNNDVQSTVPSDDIEDEHTTILSNVVEDDTSHDITHILNNFGPDLEKEYQQKEEIMGQDRSRFWHQ